jgi:catechol 2,3-dioxygenase-like lactoylglutathione lyase family enzyme
MQEADRRNFMALQRLDHYNIETVRPDETVAFYCDVLGCVNAPERRPAVPVPGTWLLVDDHAAIHVNFVDEDQAAPTGAIDHVAFEASGYLEMCAELDTLGVNYDTVESPQFDLMQIYVIDPNQIRVEINIRGEAEAVATVRDGA